MTAPRGRLGAYAWWQARDYATGPGLGTLVLTALVGVVPIFVGVHALGPRSQDGPVDQLFAGFVQFLALVGPIVAVGGMVSADRQPGLARFLFAKPVAAPLYYLQMWMVRGAGLMLITAALSLLVHQFAAPVAWVAAVLGVGVAWVLIGGVGFLASTLVPRDSVYVIGLYAVTSLLDQIIRLVPQWTWVKSALAVLPPMHKLGDLRTALLHGAPIVWPDLWHVLAWGVASVVAAVVLVRRLPLVR